MPHAVIVVRLTKEQGRQPVGQTKLQSVFCFGASNKIVERQPFVIRYRCWKWIDKVPFRVLDTSRLIDICSMSGFTIKVLRKCDYRCAYLVISGTVAVSTS